MLAHVLRSNPASVSATFYDTAGVVVDPGVVTVTITRLDGTVVVAGAATTGTGAATRSYVLTAAQTATLDTLSVAFTSASLGQTVTESVEVIGALLYMVAEARAFDSSALASMTTYTTATIEEARARIMEQFETICGVSFVPRYRLDTLNGSGLSALTLDRVLVTAVRSVETRAAGAAIWTPDTLAQLADIYVEPWGEIRRETLGTFTLGRRNLRVGYEHGYSSPPHDIKRAALMSLKHELIGSNIDPRAISISTDTGSTQLWTPGLSGRGTAIHPLPEVDRVLKLYAQRMPVVA